MANNNVMKHSTAQSDVDSKIDHQRKKQDCLDLFGKWYVDTLDVRPVETTKAVKKSIKLRCMIAVEKQSSRATCFIGKCFKEEEVPDDDHYIFCQKCQGYYYGECPVHNFKIIEDNDSKTEAGHSDAMKSLPENLCVKNSLIPEAGLGVFSKVKLEVNMRFGPYKGTKIHVGDFEDDSNTSYMWEIVRNRKILFYIDGQDSSRGNWMRYVNCSRCEIEQNLVSFQYHGEIYYRVYKPIEPNTELLVWYGDEYAEQLRIPLFDEELSGDTIGGHTCKHCGRMYMYQRYLESHLKICPVLTREKLWECEKCNRKYSTEEYLDMHQKNDCTKNERLQNDSEKKCAGGDRNCEYCGKRFTSDAALKRHLQTHTGEKPYQCKHCRKSFSQYSNLKRHILTHTGEKRYRCEHCRRGFTRCDALKLHVHAHTGEKPYQCKYCRKRFTRGGSLQEHLRIHTGETPYQCKYCRKSFSSHSNLRIHLRAPYKCERKLINVNIVDIVNRK